MITRQLIKSLLPAALILTLASSCKVRKDDDPTGNEEDADETPVEVGEDCGGEHAPSVELLYPEAARDIATDPVISGESLTASCLAEPGSGENSTSLRTVTIRLFDAKGDLLEEERARRVSNTNEFEAVFDLANIKPGPVSLICQAVDTKKNCGEDTSDTYYDPGPEIEFEIPTEDSVHSNMLEIRYRVLPRKLAKSDKGAKVFKHELRVANKLITAIDDEGEGEFSASVDFADTDQFDVDVSGQQQVEVRAWNSRDDAVRSTKTVNLLVDGTGPEISILDPEDGEVRGGTFELIAEIEDASPLEPESVVAVFDEERLRLQQDDEEPSLYKRRIDLSGYDNTVRELTVDVVARDAAGNESTAAVNVKLDTSDPFVSLDPPSVVQGRLTKDDVLQCSGSFDPVGSDAVNDGQVVGTAAEFRARVEDMGNGGFATEGTVTFLSGIDPDAVELYISDQTDVPLLIDTDNDSYCDEINPDLMPAADNPKSATVVELVGIKPKGRADFSVAPGVAALDWPETEERCVAGEVATAPSPVCGSTPMTRIIQQNNSADTKTPVIYGKPPVVTETCAGDSWDFQGNVDPGFSCVALRVEDHLGNTTLSAPLRVCFTDGGEDQCPAPPKAIVTQDLPACTDGCTPAQSFKDVPEAQFLFVP